MNYHLKTDAHAFQRELIRTKPTIWSFKVFHSNLGHAKGNFEILVNFASNKTFE
jgi:hypothetical protein